MWPARLGLLGYEDCLINVECQTRVSRNDYELAKQAEGTVP